MAPAGLALRVVVHESQHCSTLGDIDFDATALLARGVISGHASGPNTASMQAGAVALVIGTGRVGLYVVQGTRIAGGRRIIAIDLAADKARGRSRFRGHRRRDG